eukprot:gene9589-12915_t
MFRNLTHHHQRSHLYLRQLTVSAFQLPKFSNARKYFPTFLYSRAVSSNRYHIRDTVIASLTDVLNKKNDGIYRAEINFIGENCLAPVDAALYCNDELMAFIEVDGDHFYDRNGEIKPEIEAKNELYILNYPQIPTMKLRPATYNRNNNNNNNNNKNNNNNNETKNSEIDFVIKTFNNYTK